MKEISDTDFMASAFATIYKLLNRLEKFLDHKKVDAEQINHKALNISYNRWSHYIQMLTNEGYIDGVMIKKYITGELHIDIDTISITLKGLQYLQENSLLMKASRIAKVAIEKI